jgi:hypothetical protein
VFYMDDILVILLFLFRFQCVCFHQVFFRVWFPK